MYGKNRIHKDLDLGPGSSLNYQKLNFSLELSLKIVK